MGSLFRRKRFWSRCRNGLAKATFSATVVSSVAFGFLLGFIAFAQPSDVTLPVTRGLQLVIDNLKAVMERSTWGEWAGAVATAIVGVGAAWYAKEAHDHRVQETNEQYNRATKETRKKIWFVYLTVIRCNRALMSHKSFLQIAQTSQSPELLQTCLELAARKTREIVFNDIDKGVIPDECFADYALFVTRVETASDTFEVLARNVDLKGTTPLSGPNLSRLNTFEKDAKDLAEHGEKLKAGLLTARRKLKFRRPDARLS